MNSKVQLEHDYQDNYELDKHGLQLLKLYGWFHHYCYGAGIPIVNPLKYLLISINRAKILNNPLDFTAKSGNTKKSFLWLSIGSISRRGETTLIPRICCSLSYSPLRVGTMTVEQSSLSSSLHKFTWQSNCDLSSQANWYLQTALGGTFNSKIKAGSL